MYLGEAPRQLVCSFLKVLGALALALTLTVLCRWHNLQPSLYPRTLLHYV